MHHSKYVYSQTDLYQDCPKVNFSRYYSELNFISDQLFSCVLLYHRLYDPLKYRQRYITTYILDPKINFMLYQNYSLFRIFLVLSGLSEIKFSHALSLQSFEVSWQWKKITTLNHHQMSQFLHNIFIILVSSLSFGQFLHTSKMWKLRQ